MMYVADSMSVWNLLREFRIRKVHMAVVLNEYGGTIGVCAALLSMLLYSLFHNLLISLSLSLSLFLFLQIVTLEDVVEEIVGEIFDENDSKVSVPSFNSLTCLMIKPILQYLVSMTFWLNRRRFRRRQGIL